MAFKGDLKNVHLADLLQTLSQNDQEGVLSLSLSGETRRIHFGDRGITLLDPQVASRRRLGEILVSANLITDVDLTLALKEQSKSPRFLGEILVQQGKVSQEELSSILQVQVEEELYNLFSINQGLFEFRDVQPGEAPLPHMVPFQVDGIVLEAARRLDEWQVIQQRVPDLSRVYLAIGPDSPIHDEESRLVLEKLNGRRSVQDTADALLSSPFAVAKVMAGLVECGGVREAEPHELLESARRCLDEGDEYLARKLLNCLRQMNAANSDELLEDLAGMLREAGDGRASAQVRLRIARLARDQEDLTTARENLRIALEDQPDSTAILGRLCDVHRDLGEEEAELEGLRKLGQLHAQGGDPEDAIRCFERVLVLEPDDVDNYRRLADVYLRARLKDRAIEVLEDQVEVIKRLGQPRELLGAYQRILGVDPGRSDIKRQIVKMRRSRTERILRASVWLVATCIALSLSGAYYWQKRERRLGMDKLDGAMVLYQSNDLKRAPSQLQDALKNNPHHDVVLRATRMLDQIDVRLADEVRKDRQDVEFALDGKLVQVQRDIDARRFAKAVDQLMVLLEEEKEAYLRKRIYLRLKACADTLVEQVSQADEVAFQYRRPETDHEVEPAYLRVAAAFPAGTQETIEELRTTATRALLRADEDSTQSLEIILNAAKSWSKTHTTMDAELRSLEEKYGRLRTLHRISGQYLTALEAATEGDLEQALVLFRGVLDDYGEGGLREHLQEKVGRIERAMAIEPTLDGLLASGEFVKAHETALAAVGDFQDLNLARSVRIPLLVQTSPPGADVMLGPQKLGTTPAVVRVDWQTPMEVRLYHPDFSVLTLTLDPAQPTYEMELQKESLVSVNLGVALEVPPVVHDSCFYVASRDGVLTRIDPSKVDEPTSRFETGSLSGSRTFPVSTPAGLVVTVVEGRVWMLNTNDEELTARWNKTFEAEIRVDPVAYKSDVLVLLHDNTLVSLRQKDGRENWRISVGETRVVSSPTLSGRLLYLSLDGGFLGAFDLVNRKPVYRQEIGEDLHGRPVVEGDLLVVTTITGEVVALNKRTGEILGRTRTRDLPKGDAVLHHGVVDLSLGDRVVRIDPLQEALVHTWGPGLSLSGAPAPMGSSLLIGGKDGYLYGLEPGAVKPVFRTPISDSPVLGRAALTDQYIGALSEDGTFRIFRR